eukprot:5503510-Pyramimonas_sp.AAC.1
MAPHRNARTNTLFEQQHALPYRSASASQSVMVGRENDARIIQPHLENTCVVAVEGDDQTGDLGPSFRSE